MLDAGTHSPHDKSKRHRQKEDKRTNKKRRVSDKQLFDRLPDEIILVLFAHCTLGSVARVAVTCRRLSRLATDPALWKAFYVRDFPPCPEGDAACLLRVGTDLDQVAPDLYAHVKQRISRLMDVTQQQAPWTEPDGGDTLATLLVDRRVSLACPHHWPLLMDKRGPRWAYASNMSPPRPCPNGRERVFVGRITVPKDGADGPWTYRGDLVAASSSMKCDGASFETANNNENVNSSVDDDDDGNGDEDGQDGTMMHACRGTASDGTQYLGHGDGTIIGTGCAECFTGQWNKGMHTSGHDWWNDWDGDNSTRSHIHWTSDGRYTALSARHLAIGNAASDGGNSQGRRLVTEALWTRVPLDGKGFMGFGIRYPAMAPVFMAPELHELCGSGVVRCQDDRLSFVGDIVNGNATRGKFYARSGRLVYDGTTEADIAGYHVLRNGTVHTLSGTALTSDSWCLYWNGPDTTRPCRRMTIALPRGDQFECEWVYDGAHEMTIPRPLVRSFRGSDGRRIVSDLGWEVARYHQHCADHAQDNDQGADVLEDALIWRTMGTHCQKQPDRRKAPCGEYFMWPRVHPRGSNMSPTVDDGLAYLDHMASSYPDWAPCRLWVRLLWGVPLP